MCERRKQFLNWFGQLKWWEFKCLKLLHISVSYPIVSYLNLLNLVTLSTLILFNIVFLFTVTYFTYNIQYNKLLFAILSHNVSFHMAFIYFHFILIVPAERHLAIVYALPCVIHHFFSWYCINLVLVYVLHSCFIPFCSNQCGSLWMCALIAFVILLALEIHCQLHEPNAKGGSGGRAREGERGTEGKGGWQSKKNISVLAFVCGTRCAKEKPDNFASLQKRNTKLGR